VRRIETTEKNVFPKDVWTKGVNSIFQQNGFHEAGRDYWPLTILLKGLVPKKSTNSRYWTDCLLFLLQAYTTLLWA